jgi:hypothetical protein
MLGKWLRRLLLMFQSLILLERQAGSLSYFGLLDILRIQRDDALGRKVA